MINIVSYKNSLEDVTEHRMQYLRYQGCFCNAEQEQFADIINKLLILIISSFALQLTVMK